MKEYGKYTIYSSMALALALPFTLISCGEDGAGTESLSSAQVTFPADNGLAAAPATFYATPAANSTARDVYLNNATANAGSTPLFANILRRQWCNAAEYDVPPPELADRAVVPITKIFDGVWFTGTRSVGQYVFKTNNGVFLIDTLNNTGEAQTITEPGLRSIGIDPRNIKAAMPTHGHGDHYGGASYLQQTYGIPIYLGSADAANKPFTVTPLDSSIMTPQTLTVDGYTFTLLSTPGHTPGTFSGIMPVQYGGKSYKVAFWGGTGMPKEITAARQYLDGAERLYRLAYSQGADGTIHTHPFVDGSLSHIDEIRSNGLGATNPFLIGKANTARSLAVLRSCAAAMVGKLDPSATLPQWHVTTMDLAANYIGSRAGENLSASARVVSPYGLVQAVDVEFLFGTNQRCTARTDQRGVATCTVSASSNPGTVTAEMKGTASDPRIVLLPSTATGEVKNL